VETAVLGAQIHWSSKEGCMLRLLEQDAELIASVGRHKIVADTENKDKRIQSFFNAVSVVSIVL